MANSINTNVGALVALQNLNATNRDLNVTQNRVNTGFKVATAKDNGAIFAIATNQRADIASLDAVKNSVSRGQSLVDVALAAGDTVVEAFKELKSIAVALETVETDSAAETAYQADYDALVAEIDSAIEGAKFDGINLFDGTVTTVRTGLDSTATYDVGFEDAVTSGVTAGDYDDADAIQTAIEGFTANLATLGTQSKSLGRQNVFVGKLQDALEVGVDNLVAADLAKESARLTALQTKQQLGVQALSIANQSSSILLGLFR
ncbi:flagellin [Brevundimonas guildfordensis]|uniref:Flagellin n=1 Tax=Brevundimonas guildfordensis TaxID=2762241 RepID=A0ABR8QYS1_9CAUL|nr:flagellin [Brevundimonas guildfordensis]MBD7940683.1 flagellin [Brevundimonas guildfordensis]